MKQSVTVGAQLLWGGRHGCNNGRYGCTIVMSYIEINKAVSQWLLTFNLCVSVTWPLTCAFHIPCTHTPEIIDMHRGVCDNNGVTAVLHQVIDIFFFFFFSIFFFLGLRVITYPCHRYVLLGHKYLFIRRSQKCNLTLTISSVLTFEKEKTFLGDNGLFWLLCIPHTCNNVL